MSFWSLLDMDPTTVDKKDTSKNGPFGPLIEFVEEGAFEKGLVTLG